ncbi:MAG: hypothetical protein F6K28_30860, partial [Microcoleus sp. SIO2G3]|nr:hypothetical protein [Microcoleus sp. SIO2G3]
MLKFEYRLTERDYLEAQCEYQRSRRFLYVFSWLASIQILVLLALTVPPLIQASGINWFLKLSLVLSSVMAIAVNPELKINVFKRWLL